MRKAVGSLAGPKVASAPTMPRALLASPPMMTRESSSPARFETALSPSRRAWLQVTVTPRSSQGVRPRASERPASSARDERRPDSDRAGPRTTSTWLSWVTACSAKSATAHGRVCRAGAQGTPGTAGWVGRPATRPRGVTRPPGVAGVAAGRRLYPMPAHTLAVPAARSAFRMNAYPDQVTADLRMMDTTATQYTPQPAV